MNEWARLVDRYGAELKKFDLVCAFCGCHLSDHTVNGECPDNNQNVLRGRASASQNSINMGSEGIGHMSMYYTEDEPPMEFIGAKRHWFGRPSIKGITKVNPAGVKMDAQSEGAMAGFGMAQMSNSQAGFSQNPSGQVMMKNPESSEAIRNLCNSQRDLRNQFEIQFR